jgi:hypothetical protein
MADKDNIKRMVSVGGQHVLILLCYKLLALLRIVSQAVL